MAQYYQCPRISNEFPDCSLPMTADTTSLCTFQCNYCFARFQKEQNPAFKKKKLTTFPLNLNYFEGLIEGKYPENPYYKKFISKKFPLHFGGLSDAFCHYEKEHKVTLKLMEILGKNNYPVIFSTKGDMMAYGKYYDLLNKYKAYKNFAFQFSIITTDPLLTKQTDAGCPPIKARFTAMRRISDLGYWTILRLRPYIIGISNLTIKDLFYKSHEAGARAVSMEFFCHESRSNEKINKLYDDLSKLCGFNINKYYKALSPTERGTYKRLNRDVKEKYVKEMWILAKKYKLQFNISDPDFKELNESSSCCGLPDSREVYNSDLVNFSRGQLTHWVRVLLKKYLAGEKELLLTIDDVLGLAFNDWLSEKKYWGDSLKCWSGHPEYADMSHKTQFIQDWNNLNSPSNPYNYFHGLLKPVELDSNNNIIFKFNPPDYIRRWREEGLL